jgi:hypothetical protein
MRGLVIILFCLPTLLSCNKDVIVSTSYPTRDGRIAFIVDINKSDGGFELRAIRPEGIEVKALTRLSVSQCSNGQLFWDSKDTVVFAYDEAEILYLLSGAEQAVNLSIETCTKGTVTCDAVVTSKNFGPPINNVCSDSTG